MRIPLANLLARSPLPRIGDLMEEVTRCADQVPELIELLIAGDTPGVERLAKDISVAEGLADEAKNRVRSKMPVRLMLPVDRRDVLRLISEIDAIADCAEDVGVLLTLRPLTVPESLKPHLRVFVQGALEVVAASAKLVQTLDELREASFSGKSAEATIVRANHIGQLEHEADKLQDRCAKELFKAEDELSPVAIFMWTKVLNKIGDMANHAENIGDQFRLFVAA